MKFKMNGLEKKWVLYDVGNSAFTLLVSTIMPIYFNYLAGQAGISDVNYLAYWGYATSIATILVAVLGPTLGTLSDLSGWKKKDFPGFSFGRGRGMCISWIYRFLALVPGSLCYC